MKKFSVSFLQLVIILACCYVSGSLAKQDFHRNHQHAARSTGTARSSASQRIERYRYLLSEYFSEPRHPFNNEDNWQYARTGVLEEFERIIHNVPNATLETQDFKTELLFHPVLPTEVNGQNLIVTFRGSKWQTSEDDVLVIGAHYDSEGSAVLSIDDNGSGVVAMLEVARGLADAIVNRKARLATTVIFVAFDIQRFEHELVGSLVHKAGSGFYVQDKLMPLLNREPKPKFRGAIILDSVMNFNGSEGSQILPNGFDISFTTANNFVISHNYTGNFMCLVTKERLRSLELDYALSQEWNQANPDKKFPLIQMEITRNAPSPALFEFIKQDHAAFWNNPDHPLQAVLLTDTGKWRGIARTCEMNVCNATNFLTMERLLMLDHVVVTLDRYVSRLSLNGTGSIDTTGSATTNFAGLAATTLLVLITTYLL